jgi:hypothetical protein
VGFLHVCRNGANTSDGFAYGPAFTVDFGIIALLTRQETAASVENFDENGEKACGLRLQLTHGVSILESRVVDPACRLCWGSLVLKQVYAMDRACTVYAQARPISHSI